MIVCDVMKVIIIFSWISSQLIVCFLREEGDIWTDIHLLVLFDGVNNCSRMQKPRVSSVRACVCVFSYSRSIILCISISKRAVRRCPLNICICSYSLNIFLPGVNLLTICGNIKSRK